MGISQLSGADDVDPSELAIEVPSIKDGLQKLSEILRDNGFSVSSPSPETFVLSRGPNEKVTLTVSERSINILTEDDATPGDRTFHDEVMGIIARESQEFPSQGEAKFVGNKWRKLLNWFNK